MKFKPGDMVVFLDNGAPADNWRRAFVGAIGTIVGLCDGNCEEAASVTVQLHD